MHKPLIVGIGELFWDILPERHIGGVPANIAYHASKQGTDAYLISAIGNDTDGYELRDELSRKGISDKYISTTPALSTGTAMFERDGIISARNIHTPAVWDLIQFSPQLELLAEKADAICFGILAQRQEATASTVRYFLEATRPECLKFFDLNLNHNCYSRNAVLNSLRLCN